MPGPAKLRILIASVFALIHAVCLGNTVTIVDLKQQDDRITLHYDLSAPEPVDVRLVGSVDDGASFTMPIRAVTGDVGQKVHPGKGKMLHWDLRKDYPGGIDDLDVTLDIITGSVGAYPTYVVVPVHGRVGREITAEVLKRCLDAATTNNPAAIVLEVDSPGGLIAELYHLINTSLAWQREHAEQRLVVLVRQQAMSAAAVFSTTVPEIYMMPGSAIGAAMAIHVGRDKITAVKEKFSSAYRGKARAAAEAGGHDPLLVEAMIDPDVQVSLDNTADAEARVARGRQPEAKLLVDTGKLLTLTADEAVEVELADAVVSDYAALGVQLGFASWTEGGKAARQIAQEWKVEVERVRQDYDYLAGTIKDGLSRLRQSSGTQLAAIEGNLWEVRDAIDELEQMAEDYPFMRPVVHNTFEKGTADVKLTFDKAIGELKRYKARRFKARRN